MTKVICKDASSSCGQLTEGQVYEVLEERGHYFRIKDDQGLPSCWFSERFAIAPEKAVAHASPRGSDLFPATEAGVRAFGTGATRDLDANKLDFEGFLSPPVLERYAEHMHKARRMPDGSMRDSDNWQLGIPVQVYMKSLFRHFFSVWKLHRGHPVTEVVRGETITKDLETELCAVLFNASGMLHELLKAKEVKNAGSENN